MPLHLPPAPASALRAVLSALTSTTPSAIGHTRALHTVRGVVTPTQPHPVYVLEPGAHAQRSLTTTRLSGWRFLLHDENDCLLGSAETVETSEGWAFSHFGEGPFAPATQRALIGAQALRATYQPRLLSVPGLYMLALWLHTGTTEETTGDLLVPLAPAPPGIAAHLPQQATTLLPVLARRLASVPLLTASA